MEIIDIKIKFPKDIDLGSNYHCVVTEAPLLAVKY